MATRTANTGSNNWNTNGAWVGGVQPTAADDVVIPASATVTMPAATTSLCRSLTVQAGGVLVSAATTSAMTIGDGTAGAGNVAISISSTATITLTGVGTWTLASTSATQQTIASGGKILPSLAFNGAGSSYILSASLTGGLITLLAGTFDTGNFNLTTSAFNYGATAARTLTLGSSIWSLTGAGNNFINGSAITNLTVTANAATFNFNSGGGFSRVIGRNLNWNGASFTMGSTANGGIEFQDMGTWFNFTRTGLAQKADNSFWWTGTATFTGTFTLNSNSLLNRILISSAARGTSATISAASVVITNEVDFMDITGAGAATWTVAGTGATYLGDCGGNSGITFTTPVTQTNTGATGNWSDVTKWTSRVPLPQDNVIIITGSGTITGDMPRQGKDINFTGFTGTYAAGINTEVFGSYTLSSGMTWGAVASWGMSGRGSHTLTTAGKTFTSTTTFNGFGGTYTLQDPLTSTGSVQLFSGTLDTNSLNVTSLAFSSSSTTARSLILGTTTWTITQTTAATVWNMSSFALGSVSAASSTIIIGTASANTRTFAGGDQTYGTLQYTLAGSTGQLNISGNNTFNAGIGFSDTTNARTLGLAAGSTQTFGPSATLNNIVGTSGKLMSVISTTAGTLASISKPRGGLLATTTGYLSIKDVRVSQPYIFYIGANSTNVSGNSNVNFSTPIAAPYRLQGIGVTAAATSVTAALVDAATAGNLLIAYWGSSTNAGAVTAPSGFTQAIAIQNGTATMSRIFYKVAAGGETSVQVTHINSVVSTLFVQEVTGWTGAPTLDVTSSNTSSAATSGSTTATTGPTNAVPAWGVTNFMYNASPAASISWTNNYQEEYLAATGGNQQLASIPLIAASAQSTTHVWTTARTSAQVLAVFKDVPLSEAGSFFPFF